MNLGFGVLKILVLFKHNWGKVKEISETFGSWCQVIENLQGNLQYYNYFV